MREESAGSFRLIEACARPGCPVCRCLEHDSRRYLDALLYEHVTDVDTRRGIRRSWGFCNRHTWMLRETGGAAFGAAIIWDDLVRRALALTGERGRTRRWLTALRRTPPALVERWKRRAPCLACVDAATAEIRYLDRLLALGDEPELRAAYDFSDGVCLPHLVNAAERGPDRVGALVSSTTRAWARIGRDLAAFLGKHDHRVREPFTEAEATACARALEMLAGAPVPRSR